MSTQAALAPLSQHEIVVIAKLITGCQDTARVLWSMDEGVTIREGVLRYIEGTDHGHGERAESDDIRHQFVRITTTTGMEAWLPVGLVLHLMREGLFLVRK